MISSAWEMLHDLRQTMLWMWIISMIVAVSCAVFGFLLGADAVRWPAAIFCLLGAHAMSLWHAAGHMARLQAAIDMKRIVLKATHPTLVTQNQRVRAGEPLDLVARDGTKFVVTPNVSVDVKVEYEG